MAEQVLVVFRCGYELTMMVRGELGICAHFESELVGPVNLQSTAVGAIVSISDVRFCNTPKYVLCFCTMLLRTK